MLGQDKFLPWKCFKIWVLGCCVFRCLWFLGEISLNPRVILRLSEVQGWITVRCTCVAISSYVQGSFQLICELVLACTLSLSFSCSSLTLTLFPSVWWLWPQLQCPHRGLLQQPKRSHTYKVPAILTLSVSELPSSIQQTSDFNASRSKVSSQCYKHNFEYTRLTGNQHEWGSFPHTPY